MVEQRPAGSGRVSRGLSRWPPRSRRDFEAGVRGALAFLEQRLLGEGHGMRPPRRAE